MTKLIAFVLAGLLAQIAIGQTTKPAVVATNYVPGRGFQVAVGGVPIIRSSALQLYAPGWTEGYYSSRGAKATHDSMHGEWLVEHRAPKVGFDAAEMVRSVDDRHIEWTLEGKATSDKPVRIEWAIGHVNAFTTITETATTRPTDGGRVRQGKEIALDTAVGRLTFKVEEGGVDLTLLDGRDLPAREWSRGAPTLWLGVTEAAPKPGELFKYRVSMAVQPRDTPPAAPDVTATVPVVTTDRAFVARSQPVQVIPRPKSLVLAGGRFVVRPDTKLVVVDQGAAAAARTLARDAKERFGWTWDMYATEQAHPTDHTILFQRPAGQNIRPEGYEIECDANQLVVTAGDPAGYFYAAQTMAQLLQVDDEVVYVPACRVHDWPSLAFRGVHLFAGRDALPVHRRLIEQVLARYKLNHVVLETEYARWDSDPALWTEMSVPKGQLADYVRIARANQLEVIPLVQSLGHAEWMFKNNRNRDLAEDPETPYAYSVTNPRTYPYIESIYDEALSIFGPKYFHIGHDEVANRGRYPFRDAAKEWGAEKLFLYDTNRLHDWLAAKGVTTMMWGDVLLAKSESNDGGANAKDVDQSARMRDAIPRDTVICDWHYTPTDPENYRSLKTFTDAGFRTIACTWSNPDNIYNFASAARKYGAWGLLQTTWAGYTTNGKTIADAPEQFAAYILAAEYAWSADSPRPAELGWDPGEVFTRSMGPGKVATGRRPGYLLNLSGVPGAEDPRESAYQLANLYGDDPRGNHLFHSADGAYPAITLGGALLSDKPRPTTATLNVDLPAGTTELDFLQATAFPAPLGEVVGGYELVYADGTTAPLPLRYGQETRALSDTGPTSAAEVGWRGQTAANAPAALRVFRANNPNPDKRITAVRFSTHHPYASPILFGITAVE